MAEINNHEFLAEMLKLHNVVKLFQSAVTSGGQADYTSRSWQQDYNEAASTAHDIDLEYVAASIDQMTTKTDALNNLISAGHNLISAGHDLASKNEKLHLQLTEANTKIKSQACSLEVARRLNEALTADAIANGADLKFRLSNVLDQRDRCIKDIEERYRIPMDI